MAKGITLETLQIDFKANVVALTKDMNAIKGQLAKLEDQQKKQAKLARERAYAEQQASKGVSSALSSENAIRKQQLKDIKRDTEYKNQISKKAVEQYKKELQAQGLLLSHSKQRATAEAKLAEWNVASVKRISDARQDYEKLWSRLLDNRGSEEKAAVAASEQRAKENFTNQRKYMQRIAEAQVNATRTEKVAAQARVDAFVAERRRKKRYLTEQAKDQISAQKKANVALKALYEKNAKEHKAYINKVKSNTASILKSPYTMVKGLTSAFKALLKPIKVVIKAISMLGGAVAGLVGGSVALYDSFIQNTKLLEQQAARASLSMSAFRQLSYATSIFGVDAERLSDTLFELNERIHDAAIAGAGELAPMFDLLGQDAEELAKLNPSQQLESFVDSMKGMDSTTIRMYWIDKINDAASYSMPLLIKNWERINQYREEAESIGLVDIYKQQNLQQAAESWMRIKTLIQGVYETVMVTLAPAFTAAADAVRDIIKNWNELASEKNMNLGQYLAKGFLENLQKILKVFEMVINRIMKSITKIINLPLFKNERLSFVSEDELKRVDEIKDRLSQITKESRVDKYGIRHETNEQRAEIANLNSELQSLTKIKFEPLDFSPAINGIKRVVSGIQEAKDHVTDLGDNFTKNLGFTEQDQKRISKFYEMPEKIGVASLAKLNAEYSKTIASFDKAILLMKHNLSLAEKEGDKDKIDIYTKEYQKFYQAKELATEIHNNKILDITTSFDLKQKSLLAQASGDKLAILDADNSIARSQIKKRYREELLMLEDTSDEYIRISKMRNAELLALDKKHERDKTRQAEDAVSSFRKFQASATETGIDDLVVSQEAEAAQWIRYWEDNKTALIAQGIARADIEASIQEKHSSQLRDYLFSNEKAVENSVKKIEKTALESKMISIAENQLNSLTGFTSEQLTELGKNWKKMFDGTEKDAIKFSQNIANAFAMTIQSLNQLFSMLSQIGDEKIKARERSVNESFDRQREAIDQSEDMSEEDRRKNLANLDEWKKKELKIVEDAKRKQFERDKKFKIVQAIGNTAQGVTAALSIPYVGIALAAVIGALGMAQVGIISSQQYQGQAHGGINSVPANGGRDSTWILKGGERVVQPAANRDLTKFLKSQTSKRDNVTSANVNVNVNGDVLSEQMMAQYVMAVRSSVSEAVKTVNYEQGMVLNN